MTVVKHLRGSREVRISVDLGDCESSIARFAPQNLLVRLKSRRQADKQTTNKYVCVCVCVPIIYTCVPIMPITKDVGRMFSQVAGKGAMRSRCKESQDEASFLPKAVGAISEGVCSATVYRRRSK
jgi:hypothetical protein